MISHLVAFILGIVVATVGVSSLASFVDRQVENAKGYIKENVK